MTHTFRGDGSHYNGGPEWFGYGYLADGEPRLKLVRRWYRRGERRGQAEDRYFVDGEFVADYAAALLALQSPPSFTPEEVEALARIGDKPADWRKTIPIPVLLSLKDKGAIVFGPPGQCSRTDVGRTEVQP